MRIYGRWWVWLCRMTLRRWVLIGKDDKKEVLAISLYSITIQEGHYLLRISCVIQHLMPPFPDVRPLIVNLLARYIIQCKLDGYHGLPGQKSQQDWAHLLEGMEYIMVHLPYHKVFILFAVLCSTLDQPSKISYSSLQFVRYVSLLEKVQKIRMGKLSEHTLTDIYKMLVNFSKSPELSNTVIADKLTSLRNDMHSGLTGRVMAEFCTKVCDFVRLAMEWYATLPVS